MSLKRKSLIDPTLENAAKLLANFWRRGGIAYWVATYVYDTDGCKPNLVNALSEILVPDLINMILPFLNNVMVKRWTNDVFADEQTQTNKTQKWLQPLFDQCHNFDTIQIGWVSNTNESHLVPDPTNISYGHVSWSEFLAGKGPSSWNPKWVTNWSFDFIGSPPSIYDQASNPLPGQQTKIALENAKLAVDKSVGIAPHCTVDPFKEFKLTMPRHYTI